jgi:hypothetical protein
MASKPVEPRPQYFAGILIYGKTKFVENLKCIGALMRKFLKAIAHKVMMDFTKNIFYNFFIK